MNLRIAIVGLGTMGRIHALKVASLAGVELVCAVDPDPAALAWDGLPAGTARFRSLNQAVPFDAAIVATPPTTHFEVAGGLVARGVHCLVEKPICTSAADGRALLALAREKGVVLASGHNERLNPAFRETIRRAGSFLYAEAERIGPFSERSTDADVVLDLMVHDLDALCAFNPGIPADVRAVGIPVLTGQVDIANARIEFAGGAVATLTASRVSVEKRRKFRVFSRAGYFSADLVEKALKIITVSGDGAGRQIEGDSWIAPPSDQVLEQDRSFVEAIVRGGAPATDAAHSIEAMDLADRVRAAMRQPQPGPICST
ncbi:MAG: Gfo/Idh/MocA family oxidoreductase [Deltaproteobacteria bacterium]|nr:Gfo/Idh/MocA family oxidoreductase [Deltaproteobacteria bacterium]